MNNYSETIEKLTSAGFMMNPFPLIWYKDRGLIPDPRRGPRRVYETVLHGSLGDRKIIRSTPNVSYHKVQKEAHISTKPQDMLQPFFRMFCDELTEMLDPTCGGGTALAPARSLGAKRVVGLDIEEDFVEASRLACQHARRRKFDDDGETSTS